MDGPAAKGRYLRRAWIRNRDVPAGQSAPGKMSCPCGGTPESWLRPGPNITSKGSQLSIFPLGDAQGAPLPLFALHPEEAVQPDQFAGWVIRRNDGTHSELFTDYDQAAAARGWLDTLESYTVQEWAEINQEDK